MRHRAVTPTRVSPARRNRRLPVTLVAGLGGVLRGAVLTGRRVGLLLLPVRRWLLLLSVLRLLGLPVRRGLLLLPVLRLLGLCVRRRLLGLLVGGGCW